ncbi:MAG: LemA family protein [Actinobacteria bacterium]|nr:LemA family protein [Actinomycetota bacterium]MBI3256749.1 LemA family protein [Actinomycetota bacterium]
MPVAVVAGVIVLVGLLFALPYNGLVSKEASADRAFADLDVQLQRRNDLIPNLVGAVKGALNQEQTVFGDLAVARQAYAGARSLEDKAAASGQIDAGIGRLLAIVENYPELRSNENIRDLQTQLEGTENRIAQSRRDFNGAVTSYNVAIRRFPRRIVAGVFGFDRRPLFEAAPESTENPTVDLGNSTTTVP